MSMNISPHIPQVVVNSATPATESLAKANVMREVVPPIVQTEAIVPQKSREQDVRPPINQSSASTYEGIQLKRQDTDVIPSSDEQAQGEQSSEQNGGTSENNSEQTKSGDEKSANESDATVKNNTENEQSEKRAKQEQQQLETQQIQELQQRDNEVRAHEQAHSAIGGTHAGSPNYEYQTGPNGQKYAVGGEVSIDVSKEATPEATIRKMQTVQAAALAPAEPSSQDRKVAAQAARNIADARAEVVQQNASSSANDDESKTEGAQVTNVNAEVNGVGSNSSDSRNDIELPNQMSLAKDDDQNINRTLFETKTSQVISNKYANATVPHEQGFSAVA